MQIILPKEAAAVIQKLNQQGYEAVAVGGCVRDSVISRPPCDWDIATSALPQEIKRVFAGNSIVETGIRHGTLTVFVDDLPLEITTYRIDGAYTDNRHPDDVQFTTILREDLARRDFTVNALAYHPEMGLIDLFGGMQDLKQHRIRCVGDPDCRFSEDSLRVMRGIRFCSQLSFSMESKTEKSLRKNASLLSHVAAERLSAELLKLLCGENVCAVLLQYSDILGEIIPEILPMVHFNQHTPYHIYDVYEHTARSVAAVLATPICRLTMLLHDIGKPHCLTKDENGRGHFKGHGKISVSMAETILNRLRLDKHTIESVLLLIRYHDAVIEPSMPIVKRWLNRLTPEMFFMLLEVKFADNKAQNPTHDRQESYREIRIIAELVLSQQECFSLKMLAINGDDLIAQGIMPGKALGETLHFLLQAVMDNRCANEKDALLAFLEETSHPS